MDSFYPSSFFQASAGVFGVCALIFGALSLFSGVRVHAIRMLAILLVVAMSLYANAESVYFIAVFIIATAVTELEFLQTLAAIIRGNKDYFIFRKETLSSEAKYKSSQAELMDLESVPDIKRASDTDGDKRAAQEDSSPTSSTPLGDQPETKTGQSNDDIESAKNEDSVREVPTQRTESTHHTVDVEHVLPTKDASLTPKGLSPWSESSKKLYRSKVERVIELEREALNYLQALYGTEIERNVVYQSNVTRLELDGLISRPMINGYVDQIFEVKYIGAPSKVHALLPQLRYISLKTEEYSLMTKRRAMMRLVVILDGDNELPEREKELLNSAIQNWGVDGLFVLNSKDLKRR